jgi:hypothetical protein
LPSYVTSEYQLQEKKASNTPLEPIRSCSRHSG